MDKESELIISIILKILVVTPLSFLMFLPTWFVLTNNWSAYVYWVPIVLIISRWLYGFMIILSPLIALVDVSYSQLLNTVRYIFLAIWGMPILTTALVNLASTQLSGIDLQTTILQIIIIEGLSIVASNTSLRREKKNG